MKRKSLNILAVLISFSLAFVACEKDDQVKLDAQMESWKIDGITSTSAELSGMVVAQGDGFTEFGVCWNTSENPTIDNSSQEADEVDGAVYWVTVTGLDHLTKYYYKAYVVQSDGSVLYGEQKSFTTLANIATVTLSDEANLTDRTVDLTGNVTYDGKAEVTAKGFCWSTEANPTVASDTVLVGAGTGEFYYSIIDLMPSTTYYVKSYAINSVGVAYSSQISFTTSVGVPVVETNDVSNVTKTTASVAGEVIHNGGSDISERGFVYGLTENPTVADTKLVDAEVTVSTMSVDIDGLEPGVTYHVRAYAINSTGTAYGDNVEFTTVPDIITWYLPGSYVTASYPVGGYDNWSPESSPYVQNTLSVGDKLEGYVYLGVDNSEWKFATDNTWSTNYGDDGADGTLEAGGANIVSAMGYYKINVDLSVSPYTYTAVKTDWGVIGDATPGEWGTSTDLTYDAASQTWRGVVHLKAGGFKFRANNAWDYNYGSSDGVNLVSGGDNITNDVEDDYDFTLDLSNPNEYTYTAYRWGIIGDATPGGWDTDTNMSWDSTNKVFTVTADLLGGKQFKFRANDGWTVNLGGSLTALEQDGSNIDIAEDGNYTITLNTMTNVATVVKN
ncbi:hypothetical protein [Carboxylicivirga caseinilyticus]|uniref:hypothetical protein n=1 Tax=Carboxylicivirga caseinilyticus TaxID=3417572 RepID=UPI003D333F95|nr:SusF/SusE family outer membrane protein [Marinilabiliaceae bacterium A049]